MSYGRWILISSLAVVVSSLCLAQTRRPSTQRPRTETTRPGHPYMQYMKDFEEREDVTRAVLKNGLTVLVNESRTAPLAAISMYVKAGLLQEPDEVAGVSHAIERMLFEATSTRGAGVIDKEIRAMGGVLRASSNYDHSAFLMVVPSSQWKKALEIQADGLLNPLFQPEALKREVEAILGEAREKRDHPQGFPSEKLLALGFTQHRLRRPPMGREDALQRLSQEKLLDFHRNAYVPGRMVLVVSGDVNTSEILNETVRLYGKSRGAGEKLSISATEPEQGNFRYQEVRGPVQLPQLLFGFHAPRPSSEDHPAFEVLRALIGMGEGSILARRLKAEKKIILRGSANLLAIPELSYLILEMEVEPGNIDQSELALLTELEVLRREEPDVADLDRAQALLERKRWGDVQTLESRAATFSRIEALRGWRGMNDYVGALRKVKPADVTRVAKKYLSLENCSVLEYLPEGGEPRNLSTEVIQKTLQGLLEPSTQEVLAAREKATKLALQAGERAGDFKYSEIRYPMQKASVLRGPELFIREDHTAPVIDLGIFLPGGKLSENKENAGITSLMLATMLAGGTKEMVPERFFQQLEIFGAEIVPVVGDDSFGFYSSVLSRNIERTMDLLLELIRRPQFDPERVAREKELQLAGIRRDSDSSFACAYRLLEQGLFGDFPYALRAAGNESSVSSLTVDAIQAWYKSQVQERKPLVVIIGDTHGTNLARYFVRNFSGSRYQDVKLAETFPKPIEKRLRQTGECGSNQGIAMIGFPAPPDGDEDAFALEVLQSYASGPGGRLAEQLKERHALMHDVSMNYSPRLRGGLIAIYALNRTEDVEKSLKGLEEEISRLSDTPVSYKEYRSAVNSAVGSYLVNQQRRSIQISTLVRHILNGTEIEGMNQHVTQLQAVEQEALQEVARRFLKMDRSVTVDLHGKSNKPAGTQP
jgi:zinc protease